jgi:hypothetical protein
MDTQLPDSLERWVEDTDGGRGTSAGLSEVTLAGEYKSNYMVDIWQGGV